MKFLSAEIDLGLPEGSRSFMKWKTSCYEIVFIIKKNLLVKLLELSFSDAAHQQIRQSQFV